MMKKQFMAGLVAFLMTACVGASIFAIGGAALRNGNGVAALNAPPAVSSQTEAAASQPTRIDQLQVLVSQYQDREQQYQQREAQLQEQLSQANTQIQQDQQTLQQVQVLLAALQQRGLIVITRDGRILINR